MRQGEGCSRIGRRWPQAVALLSLPIFAALTGGCGKGALDAHSSDAMRIAQLWWVVFSIAGLLFIIIMGILAYALFHRRGPRASTFEREPAKATAFVLIAGGLIPLVILIGVFAYSLQVTRANTAPLREPLRITVVGHDWWWEFKYPDLGLRTVNSIHIPAGRPVELTLTADEVIHSFWVAQLNGKSDAIPGIKNRLTITAADPGIYRGVCAEFCGVGHLCMQFDLVVDEPTNFSAWVTQVKAIPYQQPTQADEQYMLNVCVNKNIAPVCTPSGCPDPLPPVAGVTPTVPQFQPAPGSPSNNTGRP